MHEQSVTIQQSGPGWWVVNGHDGSVLGGPYPTPQEANNYAKMRSAAGSEPSQLGDLGAIMGEGYPRQDQGGGNAEPYPTEQTPPGHPDIYSAQAMPQEPSKPAPGPLTLPGQGVAAPQEPPRPQPGPIMLPPRNPMGPGQAAGGPLRLNGMGMQKPGLGQLAQGGGPQLDPRMQEMMRQAEQGAKPAPQQYFRQPPPGQPQQPPMPQQPQPMTPQSPGAPLPGGGPRPGESESDYIKRMLGGR